MIVLKEILFCKLVKDQLLLLAKGSVLCDVPDLIFFMPILAL